MPQETKSKFAPDNDTLKNLTAEASDPTALRQAVKMAVDYRGDVTIVRKSTDSPIECFIFDVREAENPEHIQIRAIMKDADDRVTINMSDIASIAFTGRDTAAGKSFDTWMKKYVAKKLAGEKASIESEQLDD